MGWVGNNSWTHPLFFSRHLVPQNVGNIIFVCYFLNIGSESKKRQCSRHFSKKSIPGLFYLEPHRKVNATILELFTTNFKNLKKKRPTRFQTLTVWWNMGFQKPGICPRQPPGGFLYFQKWPPFFLSRSYWPTIKIVICWQNGFLFLCFFLGPSWPCSLGQAL